MGKARSIEIHFPVAVEFPPGFERTLDALVDMVCEAYELKHPDRTMWPAGYGAKPIWNEPQEPTFDDSIYYIEVAEREANEKELKRRG